MSFGTSGWVLIVSTSPCFIAVPQQGTQNVEFNNLVYHITKHIKSAWQGRCKPNAESLHYAEVQPVLTNLFAKVRKKGEYFVTLCQIINKS